MQNDQIGYITLEFYKKDIKKLSRLVKRSIDEKYVLSQGAEGGIVIDSAHLTLFFGLYANSSKEIINYISKISFETLIITGIGYFPVPKYKCKILYFMIDDSNKKLEQFHNGCKEFSFDKEKYKPLVPHITIAYVRDDFPIDALHFDFPMEISIKKIQYILYS